MDKVIVGMSGGVDSSLTAYLLREQGYKVVGVSLIMYDRQTNEKAESFSSCSAISTVHAKRNADYLGIEHISIDVRDQFKEKVIEPFIDGYARGITPNPCILCNKYIKFPSLIRCSEDARAAFVATGHYARIKAGSTVSCNGLGFGDNGFALLKGIDMRKDQSYVLYVLSRGDLSRVILPLGQKTKEEVRKLSGQLNLPAAIRPESQEICFIGKGKCAVFLKYIAQPVEGPIRDAITGNIIGRHRGIHLYTIGQRKRLIAAGTPLYVVKIDSSANTIYVGPKALAMKREFRVRELNWLVNIDRFTKENRMIRPEKALSNHAAGASNEGFRATVKVRSTMRDEPATIQLMHDRAMVCFDELQWAPAPGQSAVFYCGETVLGGGVITD